MLGFRYGVKIRDAKISSAKLHVSYDLTTLYGKCSLSRLICETWPMAGRRRPAPRWDDCRTNSGLVRRDGRPARAVLRRDCAKSGHLELPIIIKYCHRFANMKVTKVRIGSHFIHHLASFLILLNPGAGQPIRPRNGNRPALRRAAVQVGGMHRLARFGCFDSI